MASITIETFKSFEYREVWKVLTYRDGLVYKTKSTGKFIHRDDTSPYYIVYFNRSTRQRYHNTRDILG